MADRAPRKRRPPTPPTVADGSGPAAALIDHGHRDDCGYCEGQPCAMKHDYVPPELPPIPRDRAGAMEAIGKAFPGAQVTDIATGQQRPSQPPQPAQQDEDDPYALPDDSAGIVVPAGRVTGDDLVDRLLCLRPLKDVTVDTDYGPKQAIECYVVEVTDEGDGPGYYDHGRMPLLWMHVLVELRKATPAAPWVLGRIVKRKTAYFCNPPTPREAAEARRQLAAFLEARKAGR